MVASINGPTHTTAYLLKAIHEARRNKDAGEMEWMRKASEITSAAHEELMRAIANGEATDENEAEATFTGYCRRKGCVLLSLAVSQADPFAAPNGKPTPLSLQLALLPERFTTSITLLRSPPLLLARSSSSTRERNTGTTPRTSQIGRAHV